MILDSSWVENSVKTQIQRPDLSYLELENGGYGYQFWTYNLTIGDRKLRVAEAKGNGGQSIFICEALDLVVVITAGNYGDVRGNKTAYKILEDYILPAFL